MDIMYKGIRIVKTSHSPTWGVNEYSAFSTSWNFHLRTTSLTQIKKDITALLADGYVANDKGDLVPPSK